VREPFRPRNAHPPSCGGEPMDTFEPPKYLPSLIAAVNDGAKAAQTGAFAFALVGLYLVCLPQCCDFIR
jgi:hypothetical protein